MTTACATQRQSITPPTSLLITADAWNTHDAAAVASYFAPEGSLRDWDVSVTGADQVGEANGKIFEAVPTIRIEVRLRVDKMSTKSSNSTTRQRSYGTMCFSS